MFRGYSDFLHISAQNMPNEEEKSFNVAHILPLSLHIFSLGIFAKPVNHAFLPDRGAFLNLRPSGFPSHSSGYDSRRTAWQRIHTALWFWTLYLDICSTESTVESWVVTGNKGSRGRVAWTTGQYLVCMLMTWSPGCPNHVFSFKNLGPFLTMCTVILYGNLYMHPVIHWNYFMSTGGSWSPLSMI